MLVDYCLFYGVSFTKTCSAVFSYAVNKGKTFDWVIRIFFPLLRCDVLLPHICVVATVCYSMDKTMKLFVVRNTLTLILGAAEVRICSSAITFVFSYISNIWSYLQEKLLKVTTLIPHTYFSSFFNTLWHIWLVILVWIKASKIPAIDSLFINFIEETSPFNNPLIQNLHLLEGRAPGNYCLNAAIVSIKLQSDSKQFFKRKLLRSITFLTYQQ